MPSVGRRTFLDFRIGLAFVAGCAAGASLPGGLLVLANGLVSPVPHPLRWVGAAALTGVVLLAERGVRGLRLPQTERQIVAEVVANRRPGNAWRFAVPYGTGLRTYLPSASPHVLVCWLLWLAPTVAVVAAAVAFGVGRGLPLLGRSLVVQRGAYATVLERTTERLKPALPLLVAVVAGLADLWA